MSMIQDGAVEARWTRMGPSGFHPPLGIFVEFFLTNEDKVRYGVTAQLGEMGPRRRCETVFVSLGQAGVQDSRKEVFLDFQVSEWRETNTIRDGMRAYTY